MRHTDSTEAWGATLRPVTTAANTFALALIAWMAAVVLLVASPVTAASAAAPERHFEQVSPPEKGDGDIIGEGLASVASGSGDGAIFESRLLFGDAVSSGTVGRTTYLARRGADGVWSTHGVTVPARPDAIQVLSAGTKTEVFSADLSSALVWGYDLPGATGAAPELNSFYQEDTATRALQTISHSYADQLQLPDFFNRELWGSSDDARHVGVVSATRMLPDPGITPGIPNAYKWDNGVLSLAGILPDGTVPPGGSTIAPKEVRNTMSADGSHLVFFSPADGSGPPQLYLHVDGRPSMWVSEPEGTDKSEPENVHYEGMTPDGKYIFFDTDSPLLDSDTAAGPDLYRFTVTADPAHEPNLTLITNDGGARNDPGGYGAALVGMSDDGKRVYIHDIGDRLDLWQEGAGVKTVASGVIRFVLSKLSLTDSQPGNARVSPDGEWVAYLTFEDNEMHLYNLKDNTVTCVSCPSGATLRPTLTHTGELDYDGFRPRFLTNDGKVFFTTTGGLVPQDKNGVADVYEYDGPTKTLSLISTGTGRDPSMFTDASTSGNDVFFVTRQQLAASDHDPFVDLYDARVGPAPPTQPIDTAPACEDDSCQGLPSTPPPFTGPSSVTLTGPGNLQPAKAAPPKPKPVTNAQRLRTALKGCRRHGNRSQRKRCETKARKRYAKTALNHRRTK